MPDYGRYSDDSRTRERSNDRPPHRRRERGIFDYGDDRGDGQRDRSDIYELRDEQRYRERRPRSDRYGRNEHYGSDDGRDGLAIDETSRLIGSNKVEGTAVYGRDGRRIGSIYNFMVDKYSGRVEYAVMRYGGFMGLAQRYYPMPWKMLTYDTREGGYHVNMTERDLEDAPSFDRDSEPRFDRSYGEHVYGWYGLDY